MKKQRRAKANDRERTRMQTLNSALGDYNDNADSHENENGNGDKNHDNHDNDDTNYDDDKEQACVKTALII